MGKWCSHKEQTNKRALRPQTSLKYVGDIPWNVCDNLMVALWFWSFVNGAWKYKIEAIACSSLDLKCCPKAILMWKAWFFSLVSKTFEKWGLVGGLRSLGYALEGSYGIAVSFVFASCPPWGEQLPPAHIPPWCASPTSPKAKANWWWTRTSETMDQNQPSFSWSWFIADVSIMDQWHMPL